MADKAHSLSSLNAPPKPATLPLSSQGFRGFLGLAAGAGKISPPWYSVRHTVVVLGEHVLALRLCGVLVPAPLFARQIAEETVALRAKQDVPEALRNRVAVMLKHQTIAGLKSRIMRTQRILSQSDPQLVRSGSRGGRTP